MFVPCIPIVPRTTVINKTIVYCDTVLSLNDVGSNIKIASISGISENELEKCLKIILEANPDVVFNTIQYSRSDKKVYFYTDKVINTKTYEESKYKKYKPITTNAIIKKITINRYISLSKLFILYFTTLLILLFFFPIVTT